MTRKSIFLQGTTSSPVLHPAEDVRLALGGLYAPDGADAIKVRSGVLFGPGASSAALPCAVATPTQGTVTIAPGRFVIQGATTLSGAYLNVVDATQTLTIAGASLPTAGLFKAGYVLLHQYDTVYGDTQDGWLPELLLGTAASSAAAAALPAQPTNSIALRTFTVDSAGNITLAGTPPYTALNGEPVPCYSTARPVNPWPSMRAREIDTGKTIVWGGSGWLYGLGDTGWASVAVNNPLAGTAAVRNLNGTVTVAYNGAYNGAYNQNFVLFTLPAGSRPIVSMNVVCQGSGGAGNFPIFVDATSGNVAAAQTVTLNGCQVHFTFLAA